MFSTTRQELGIGLPAQIAESGAEALACALALVLEHGHDVPSSRGFREVINAQIIVRDPRARLLPAGWTTFRLDVAVARVVWHLRGSSALDEIAHYEAKAADYSDDGQTLSGSNVGARLLQPVDQLRAAVDRLRHDPSSRRATMVVWRPRDAVRESRDIPCTLGMTLHVRGGRLLTTTVMRSNNALRLLPYNMFELAIFGDIAAADLGLPLGPYLHLAQSLHVFNDELQRAQRTIDTRPAPGPPLPAMPGGDIWGQIHCLVEIEERLRRGEAVLDEAAERLAPYWFAFLAVLADGGIERLQAVAPGHPFIAHAVRR